MGLLIITLRHFDIYCLIVSGRCKQTGLSPNVSAVASKKAVLHMVRVRVRVSASLCRGWDRNQGNSDGSVVECIAPLMGDQDGHSNF